MAWILLAGVAAGSAQFVQGRRTPTASPATIAEKIKELGSGDPVKVAGAAYWLGEEGVAGKSAINQLVSVLGDNRPVDAAQYRKNLAVRAASTTPGQEAAAALVKIGDPAIEALIRVLKTSPNPVARQNAAWALGVIQERHALSAGLALPGEGIALREFERNR